jgi:hypothetical protein
MNTNLLSIKDVCVRYELSPVYVRRMIQKGVLKTTKVEIAKNTFKHLIAEADVDAWRAASRNSKREDGRSKYVLYATEREIEELGLILETNNIQTPIARANKVKQSA